jgi:hypothetical protein
MYAKPQLEVNATKFFKAKKAELWMEGSEKIS